MYGVSGSNEKPVVNAKAKVMFDTKDGSMDCDLDAILCNLDHIKAKDRHGDEFRVTAVLGCDFLKEYKAKISEFQGEFVVDKYIIVEKEEFSKYKEIKPELKIMEMSKKEIIMSHMMNNKEIENFNNVIDNIIDSDDNDSTNEYSMEKNDYYKNECKNLKLQLMNIDSERLSFKKKNSELDFIIMYIIEW